MSIKVTEAKGVLKVTLPETFAVKEADEFRNQVTKHISAGLKNILIDFTQCRFIDSTGLGVIVSVYKKVRELDGSLKLCAIHPQVMRVFELTRLNKVFEIYDDIPREFV